MRTITVEIQDEAALDEAARRAAASDVSLSEFVERAINEAIERARFRESLPPITQRWAGALPPMSDEQMQQALRDQRARKYGP